MSTAIRTLPIFRSDQRCAVAIVIASLAGCLPLLLFGIPAGHDGIAHASWQQLFVLELKAGVVYPRWLSGAEQGTGSPVFFFYGPIAHYLGGLVSLLGCAGCSIEHRLGITVWLAIGLSGISFFLSLRPFIDRPAAVAGSLYYMFLPYHFGIDVWTRAAFAETAAYVFFPWLLSAAWRVGRGWRPAGELAAALGMLLMTHLPSALIACGALLGVSIVRVVHGSSAVCVVRIVAGVTLGCMLAAVYVLPALSLQDMASMDRLWSGGLRFDQNFLFGTDRSAFSRPSLKTIAAATALVALVHACGLWWCNRARRELAALVVTAVVLLLFMMHEASLSVWELLVPLQRIQFPWRLLTMLDLGVAVLLAMLLDSVRQQGFGRQAALAAVLTGVSLVSLNLPLIWDGHFNQFQFRSETAKRNWQASMAAGLSTREYRTPWFAPRSVGAPQLVAEARSAVTRVVLWRGRDIEFEIQSSAPTSVVVRQNFIPTWRAVTSDGTALPMEASRDGLVKIHVPDGNHLVRLRMPLQPSEIVGIAGSTAGLLATILMLLLPARPRQAG